MFSILLLGLQQSLSSKNYSQNWADIDWWLWDTNKEMLAYQGMCDGLESTCCTWTYIRRLTWFRLCISEKCSNIFQLKKAHCHQKQRMWRNGSILPYYTFGSTAYPVFLCPNPHLFSPSLYHLPFTLPTTLLPSRDFIEILTIFEALRDHTTPGTGALLENFRFQRKTWKCDLHAP